MADRKVTLTLNIDANGSAAKQALKGVGDAATAQAQRVKAMGGGVKGIGSALSNIGGAFQGGMSNVGAAIGAIGPAAIAAAGGLAAMHAVSLASPGTMERFQIILNDTIAVIGQSLVPVIEVVGSILRTFGDVLKTVLPPASSLREILKPIGDAFRELAEALAPVFAIMKDVIIVNLKAMGVAIQILLLPIKMLAAVIKALLGEETRLADSRGAAVRNISFTTQEAGLRSVYQAAYRSGTDGEDKHTVPGWLQTINETLNKISGFVKSIADKIGASKETIKTAAKWGAFGIVGMGAAWFGGGGKKDETDQGRKKDSDYIADEIRRRAKQKEPIGAREKDTLVREMIEAFRREGKDKDDAAGEVRRLIEEARRRGIDGHPGGR